jgi:hypothetical protein
MASKPEISEVALSLPDVGKMLAEMNKRIERLEAEVFGAGADVLGTLPVKHGKGRRPLLELHELLQRRDHLTNWLERNWPYLSVALRKAGNAQEAASAIKEAKRRMQGVFYAPFYSYTEKHAESLWQFLQSGRFHGNPRNLAGAMAGLPELSWKRSFDICASHPCKSPLALEACWDHMRRNFPDRWRELRDAKTPEQVTAVLKKSRTQDPTYLHLKEHPAEALEWLKLGNPSNIKEIEFGFRVD